MYNFLSIGLHRSAFCEKEKKAKCQYYTYLAVGTVSIFMIMGIFICGRSIAVAHFMDIKIQLEVQVSVKTALNSFKKMSAFAKIGW